MSKKKKMKRRRRKREKEKEGGNDFLWFPTLDFATYLFTYLFFLWMSIACKTLLFPFYPIVSCSLLCENY